MKKKFSELQIRKLQQLGLSKNQVVLYLTSLQKGVLSALELSRLTKINRHQIYKDADILIELGLYEGTSRNKKKYIPASPSRLAKIEKENISQHEKTLSEVLDLIPQLNTLSEGQKNKINIRYYEGVDKISQGYKKELEDAKNTEVLSIVGSIENTFSFFPEKYWDKWNRQLVKQGSKSRMLVDYSELEKSTTESDKKYNRQTKFLKKFPMKANIDIFNNSIYIVSFRDEVGIWIEDAIIAQSYKILFETLWQYAEV